MGDHDRESPRSAATDAAGEHGGATGAGPTTRRLAARPSRELPVEASREQVQLLEAQLAPMRAATARALDELGSWGVVQRRADGDAATPPDTVAVAAQGVDGPGASLPHLDRIQASFGHHDVGHVRAHVGGAAGESAQAIGAQAYAIGTDVAFAQTPDVFVAAHEAAHVVQQRGGVALKGGVGERGDVYERHADAVADRAVRGESAEALLDQLAGGAATPGVQKIDQHAGVRVPDTATQANINAELFPATANATTVGAAPEPWDGAAGAPQFAARRAALVTEMHAAMSAHLSDAVGGATGMNAIAAQRASHSTPIAALEGAGRAAKADADAHFSAYATAAALTTAQQSARAAYTINASGPNRNLLDAEDAGDRAQAGLPINAVDMARWIAASDTGAVAARLAHHFDDGRSPEERAFLRDAIIVPFANAHRAELELYDLHGFAMANSDNGRIVLPTTQPFKLSTTSTNGAPSDAERGSKWAAWRIMVHEYIHQLEHPALQSWPQRNDTIGEGFCEYFTKQVLVPLLPTAAGADVARRTAVEGADHGPPGAELLGGDYSAGEYDGYLRHVEAIERHLGGAAIGAQNAMKAIFFQGHIEYLGYEQSKERVALTAPTGSEDEIAVPATITTFAALATAVCVPAGELTAANPGRTEPLTGRVHAPGCREHRVVASADGGGVQAETADKIATQNGVTVAALTAANPGVDFGALTAGQLVVIPKH